MSKSIFEVDIARATETARGIAEALAPVLAAEDALADMLIDRAQALVPPLQMAADRAGVKLKKLGDCFYSVEGVGLWFIVTISVYEDGYEVRRGPVKKSRVRWKTLGKWKTPARAIKEAKWWIE